MTPEEASEMVQPDEANEGVARQTPLKSAYFINRIIAAFRGGPLKAHLDRS
jgi:hypothetical protein